MYTIEFSKQAKQQIKALPRNVAGTIRVKIDLLAEDPFAINSNVRKLSGRDGFRLRVGDWRVLFEVSAGRLVVIILTVKPRGSAYQ